MTAPMRHAHQLAYRPDIDGLRAVAVLSVVLYHAFPDVASGGFVGVDIFFVISGFLISEIILKSQYAPSFSLLHFYSRRANRIIPALVLTLLATYALGWFALLADEYKQLGKHIAAGATFTSNFFLLAEVGYFDDSAHFKPLLHLWSLSVEAQFYLIFPIVLWLALRRNGGVSGVMALLLVASFGASLIATHVNPEAAFYLPQFRLWEFVCGGFLAWTSLCRRGRALVDSESMPGPPISWVVMGRITIGRRFVQEACSIAGICSLTWAIFQIDGTAGFPGLWAAVPVLGAVVIIYAGPSTWVGKNILATKPMIWIGLISFPLYLWHWPLLSFATIIEAGPAQPGVRVVLIAVSIFLAWVTYRFVERPIRAARRPEATVALAASISLCVGFLGHATYRHDGLSIRQIVRSEQSNAVAFEWPADKIHDVACARAIEPFQSGYCLSTKGLKPSVALIGDSHANALYDFFRDHYSHANVGVIHLGASGCPPLLGVERDAKSCAKVMNDVIAYLEGNGDIEKVFISGRFAATFTGEDFGVEPLRENFYGLKSIHDPDETDRARIFEAGLRSLVARLLSAKKEVTIILDLPELNFHPKSCLGRSSNAACRIRLDAVMERQAGYRQVIEKLASEQNFAVKDLLDMFCFGRYCYAKADGKILYRDSHHLGVWGSEYLHNRNFLSEK